MLCSFTFFFFLFFSVIILDMLPVCLLLWAASIDGRLPPLAIDHCSRCVVRYWCIYLVNRPKLSFSHFLQTLNPVVKIWRLLTFYDHRHGCAVHLPASERALQINHCSIHIFAQCLGTLALSLIVPMLKRLRWNITKKCVTVQKHFVTNPRQVENMLLTWWR